VWFYLINKRPFFIKALTARRSLMAYLISFPPPKSPSSEMKVLLKQEQKVNKKLAKRAQKKAARRAARKKKR